MSQISKTLSESAQWRVEGNQPTPAPRPLLQRVDINQSPKVQHWVLDSYIPNRHVTLLAGHGGAGKSYLALQLAACVAMGRDFLGRKVERTSVLIYSAEDPAALVVRRLHHICAQYGFPLHEVDEWVTIIDATDVDALFAESRIDGTRCGITTPAFEALAQWIRTEAIGLVIIDNAADAFAGDEIDRQQVRAFVRALRSMVSGHEAAVLLVAHVAKDTARSGRNAGTESYSGSTAWHNAARSRLFLVETDAGLDLRHEKNNLGSKRPPLALHWPEGGVIVVKTHGGAVATISRQDDTRALLRLVGDFNRRGERIPTAPNGRPNAAKLLSKEPGFPANMRPDEIMATLRQAERDGYLERCESMDRYHRPQQGWILTRAGEKFANVAASAASALRVSHAALAQDTAAACGVSSTGGMGDIAHAADAPEPAAVRSRRWPHVPLQLDGWLATCGRDPNATSTAQQMIDSYNTWARANAQPEAKRERLLNALFRANVVRRELQSYLGIQPPVAMP